MIGFKAGLIELYFPLLCVVYCANALTCYECTMSNGELCGDPLNKTVVTPVDCKRSIFTQGNLENEQFVCISTTERNSTNTIHTRRCALKSESNICDLVKEENNGYNLTRCRVCQQNLCNSSVILKSSSLGYLLVIYLYLLNKNYRIF